MSQTRIQCEGCGHVQVNCQCKHKGTERDLALAVAKLLGWEWWGKEQALKSILSSKGREKYVETRLINLADYFNLQHSKEKKSYMYSGCVNGLWFLGEHKSRNIACALAFHELVTGKKFELADGGEVAEVGG